jgi:hypothetical protein
MRWKLRPHTRDDSARLHYLFYISRCCCLQDKSASDDHERSILTRLKQQCGAQFPSKMEGTDTTFFIVLLSYHLLTVISCVSVAAIASCRTSQRATITSAPF